MPIPAQNDFLLPFLNLLSNGESLTRAQLLFRLTQHFGISAEEAQALSGNQFTLVSRVAWCDVHFCKANFVEIIPATDKQAERRELQRILHRLVNEEGVPVEDIIILTPAGEKRSQWQNDDQLGNFILTWNLSTEMPMAARICTIHSYKGLESAVVILTELHALREEIATQLLYVGLSRARHHAIIIGDLPSLAQ